MRHLRPSACVLGVALFISSCASSGGGRGPVYGYHAWEEAVMERGLDVSEVTYPFAITPEMDVWAREQMRKYGAMEPVPRLFRLQMSLFSPKEFPFSYDERMTLSAAEAFSTRRGNCLAFTSLFVALSRAMNLETFLVAVKRVPDIDKEDDLVVVNRHVVAGYSQAGQVHLFDFYLSSEAPYAVHTVIDDLTASSMYHTNIGAAALRNQELERAAFNLEIATRLSPGLAAGWINLGVARSRIGDVKGAFDAYEVALEAEPGNASALTNMAYLYRRLEMEEEARAALAAAAQGTSSPFTLIALADAEMARGNLDDAKRHLSRARRTYGDEPEVYDALARLARRSGNLAKVDKYMERAEKLRNGPD